MPTIYWSAFTWEAFATLFTGLMAVSAAYQVGIHQLAIMAKQTDIAGRQVELETLKLRSDLFDRRVLVYESTHRWLADIVRTAATPTGDLRIEYLRAMDKAKFLYRPAVHKRLWELWELGARLTLHHDKQEHDKAEPVLLALTNAVTEIIDLFSPELHLGDGPQPVPAAKVAA